MRGERRVGEPADIGSAARAVEAASADEAEVQDDAAESAHPEAEGIEAREGHVARADHQRHKVIRKSEQQRHADEEDHRRAVHGEQLVEELRRNEVVVRDGQLDAHHRGFEAADHQEQDPVHDVHEAELLVIDRDDPIVHLVEERPGVLALGRDRHRFQN